MGVWPGGTWCQPAAATRELGALAPRRMRSSPPEILTRPARRFSSAPYLPLPAPRSLPPGCVQCMIVLPLAFIPPLPFIWVTAMLFNMWVAFGIVQAAVTVSMALGEWGRGQACVACVARVGLGLAVPKAPRNGEGGAQRRCMGPAGTQHERVGDHETLHFAR